MLTIVSDLILTDAFFIKGQVENKYTRLSQLLDEYRKYFIKVKDATLVDLNSKDRIQTPLVHVNVNRRMPREGLRVANAFARKGSLFWLLAFAFALGFGTTIAGAER